MSVGSLTYRVLDSHEYIDEDLIEHADPVARFTLGNGLLKAQLSVPAVSVSEARALVDPVVRAWEFEAELRGFRVITFEFAATPEIDLATRPLQPAPSGVAGEERIVLLSRYPPGPVIRVTPEMENIWERYRRARFGFGESVQAAVYYGLTVIEARFGSRRDAAAALHMSVRILGKMGELSSTRGDIQTVRKANATSRPLDRGEAWWLDHAVRHTVLQLGHLAAGKTLDTVGMADLPRLP